MAGHITAEPSQVKGGAWYTLASCMSMMLIAGTIYGFGTWSHALKDAYDMEQGTVELLAVAGHIGNYVVLDSGYITAKFGTTTGMILGCLYACVGYMAMWMSISVFPGQVATPLLVLFCFLYGHGCGTIDNAVMTEVLADFPNNKGNVSGCVKAYYGLATATVATIYEACFRPDESKFLLFLGIYSAVAGALLVPIVSKTKGLVDQPAYRIKRKFRILTIGIMVFALYFFSIQAGAHSISHRVWLAILISIAVGMISLFALAFQRPVKASKSKQADTASCSAQAVSTCEGTQPAAPAHLPRPPARNVTGFEMLTYLDFWIFIFICIIGQGNGLMFISNAAQILTAEGEKDMHRSVTAFVATIAVFNSLARLLFGNLSEYLIRRVPRTRFLIVAMALLCVGYTLAWAGGYMFIWPAAILVGFGYGGLWGVQPPIISELFGPSDYSFKYACSAVAAAAGSLIFNDALAGPIFEANSSDRPEFPFCYSPTCYNATFLVAAALDIPALGLAVWLTARTRWIYKGGTKEAAKGEEPNDESSGSESGSSTESS